MASCFTSIKVGRGQRAAAPGLWSPSPNLMPQCRGLSPCLFPTPSSPFYLQPLTLLSQEEGRSWELGRGVAPSPSPGRRRGPQGGQEGGLWVSRQGRTGTEC